MPERLELKRTISLPMLTLYGLGTMVGGGFYALMGKVAGEAGTAAPAAFALAGALAMLSALSFAELSSRYPVTAAETRYVTEGFGRPALGALTGWMVIVTGVVSAATLAVATIGFLGEMVPVWQKPGIALLVLAMGLVSFWGIGASVALVTVITFIEVGALVYIVAIAGGSLEALPERWTELLPRGGGMGWTGVLAGSFLAFYAFIGFEDMVNMAEEVKDPRRALPWAILIGVALTTGLYVVVSTVAVLTAPVSELAASATPMATIVSAAGRRSGVGLGLVSLLAGVNGALVQIIMASRVAYGLARRGQAPAWLGAVHARTRTPHRATALMTIVILALALLFPLTALAKTTSAIILGIFATVNLALWRIKGRDPDKAGEGPRLPRALPLFGFAACVAVLLFQAWTIVMGG